MRAASAVLLLALCAACAACEPGRTIPDAGAYPHDGALYTDASGCAIVSCMHGPGTDLGPEAGGLDGSAPDDADVDAFPDAGPTCDAPRATNHVLVNPSTTFTLTHAYAVWDTTTPCPQTLHLVLTDAPVCDDTGQLITVSISKRAIDAGSVALGTYTLTAGGSASFGVQYFRPPPLTSPGSYGPCVSASQLSMVRFDTLDYASGTMTVSGSLDVFPVDCTTSAGTFELIVDFDVTVDTAPPACP